MGTDVRCRIPADRSPENLSVQADTSSKDMSAEGREASGVNERPDGAFGTHAHASRLTMKPGLERI